MVSKMSFRLGFTTFSLVALLGLSSFMVSRYPNLHRIKNKIPGISYVFQDKYEVPNTQVGSSLDVFEKDFLIDSRVALEDRVAELFITRSDKIGRYVPGGVLLGRGEVRRGNLFGRYTSYDPVRTRVSVSAIVYQAQDRSQHVLIYDEGEGGFVGGVGTLPSASDIGSYFEKGIIGSSLVGKVAASDSQKVREREMFALFNRYALELKNQGVDVVLGPVLDVVDDSIAHSNALSLDDRNFGSGHLTTRKIATWYAFAMSAHGISTVAKHFFSVGLNEGGDIHHTRVQNSENIGKRLWVKNTYETLIPFVDGVMVTHSGNPSDFGRPYSVSSRSYGLLKNDAYLVPDSSSAFAMNRVDSRSYSGMNFSGLVVVDDISMRGLLDYLSTEQLSERGMLLAADCSSEQDRAAVLAFDQGANVIINLHGDLDSAVRAVVGAYRSDSIFRSRVDSSLRAYALFKQQHKHLVN